ncbi:MAG: phage antirepressor N-terminal domain-containing protein [Chloroflexota bacterium]
MMVDTKRSLQVVEQKIVEFYEDELVAVRVNDGHIYVSLRHLCSALGIDAQAQTRRIRRQAVLEKGFAQMPITTPARGEQQAYVLRVDLVPLFLSGVSTKAVSEEIRPKLEQFQEEAAKALWEAFQVGQLTSSLTLNELLKTDSPAAQAYKMAEAIMKMAQQQLYLEAQLETHTSQLLDHEKRLEDIESTLGDPGRFITPDQAMQISQAVKAIGIEIQKRTKKNEFGAIYGQLYRDFGITSYKQLPAHKFERVMAWLTDSYRSVTGATGDDLPF